ncbi:MAG TPA: MFS transporter, partial [Solirubrobacteraceae bacterium]|nr:MFS transporter [Solirubrobacteraceae bacterium]
MTALHVRFWLLAGLGILLDGFDFFIIGVANPLIKQDFHASAAQVGLVSSAAIIGAVFGASLLGPLGDRLGRRRIFQFDLVLFVAFSLLCTTAWNVYALFTFRLLLGLAIGLDYPIAASFLSEVLPSAKRGRWLAAAFSLQAAGIVLGVVSGLVILEALPHVYAWRVMLGFGVIPAIIIIILRRGVPESPRWLAQNGQPDEARAVAERLVQDAVVITPADSERTGETPHGLKAFFQPRLFSRAFRRRTVFTAVPWFLMDIATYGVGIFTPTLLAAIVVKHADTTFIASDISATRGTAALDGFLIVGFVIAILLMDRVGRVPLQVGGFAVMAIALVILGAAEGLPGGGSGNLGLVIVGFALFNTFMNAGPNTTTYALPAEVFPSEVRAAGHGFAAGCGKLGAAVGVFLFPILEDDVGNAALLYMIAGACLIALLVTVAFRIETKG